jgi:peptidoglycan-associated lipoprotein
MQFRRLILPVVLAAMVGCSSTKLAGPATPASPPSPATTALAAALATKPAAPAQPAQATVKTATLRALDDPKSSFTQRSIYFDFDSFLIRDTDRPLIEAHAKYLASSHTVNVHVEGSSDERGSPEYNLALGLKRAEAMLESPQLLGARAGETEAISFGKEKPIGAGHDETAWAKNGRADLNYISR